MADVSTHATLPTSLVSYWELEESSGTRVDSKASNDLTDNNTVTQGTGIQGNCADFEAANTEYLDVADASQTGLDFTGDMSFSFWFQLESAPSGTFYPLITKWNETGDNRSYILYYNDNTTDEFVLSTNSSGAGAQNLTLTIGNALSTATWYHVVVTLDVSATTAEIFVDGASIGSSASMSGSVYDGTANFSIGGYPAAGYIHDGLIDEVGVWSKVLSGTEISDLYASGAGIPYLAASTFTPKVMIF